jgi:hypothetical protein
MCRKHMVSRELGRVEQESLHIENVHLLLQDALSDAGRPFVSHFVVSTYVARVVWSKVTARELHRLLMRQYSTQLWRSQAWT